jgi:serine/threonine protein kinase
MSSWSGKSVGNVVIGNLIARGGMAEVYQGRHITLERDVAVKIMRDHVEEDAESRRRFEREAQVVANLSHPNNHPNPRLQPAGWASLPRDGTNPGRFARRVSKSPSKARRKTSP